MSLGALHAHVKLPRAHPSTTHHYLPVNGSTSSGTGDGNTCSGSSMISLYAVLHV